MRVLEITAVEAKLRDLEAALATRGDGKAGEFASWADQVVSEAMDLRH